MTDERTARLEEQVRLLAAGLNLAVDDPTQVIASAVLARDGQKLQQQR